MPGLIGRYWTDYSGDWWQGFVRMACQKDDQSYNYAMVPVLILDYCKAPIEWVMAPGIAGKLQIDLYFVISRFIKFMFIFRPLGDFWPLFANWAIGCEHVCNRTIANYSLNFDRQSHLHLL